MSFLYDTVMKHEKSGVLEKYTASVVPVVLYQLCYIVSCKSCRRLYTF